MNGPLTPETAEPKRTAGRPRKVSLDDDGGLLDSMLRIQIRIAEDGKANSATRQRAADSVAELIETRARRKDDAQKTALAAENSRLQTELGALVQQIEDLKRSATGTVPVTEVAAIRIELARLRSEAQTFADQQRALTAERDAAQIGLRYLIQSLGPDGARRTAMKVLIAMGIDAKGILPLFGVDAMALLRFSNRRTKEELLDVFRDKKTEGETDLTRYCRLRLSVEHGLDDVGAELKRIAETEETERRAVTLRMMEELRNGGGNDERQSCNRQND
jgi:hypothetical protein